MNRSLRLSLLIACSFPVLADSIPKPSPFPDKRAKEAQTRKSKPAAAHSGSSDRQREVSQSPFEGTATFFRLKDTPATTTLTAAHPSLPLGSLARVTNTANGKTVTVRITERLTSDGARIVSVCDRAAGELGFLREGTAQVRIEPVAGADQ